MSNVVKMKPDQPLTVEQIARMAVDDMERELLALGIDPNEPLDDDEDDDGELSDE